MQWHPHPVAITITTTRPTIAGTSTAAAITPALVSNANKNYDYHQFLSSTLCKSTYYYNDKEPYSSDALSL